VTIIDWKPGRIVGPS